MNDLYGVLSSLLTIMLRSIIQALISPTHRSIEVLDVILVIFYISAPGLWYIVITHPCSSIMLERILRKTNSASWINYNSIQLDLHSNFQASLFLRTILLSYYPNKTMLHMMIAMVT